MENTLNVFKEFVEGANVRRSIYISIYCFFIGVLNFKKNRFQISINKGTSIRSSDKLILILILISIILIILIYLVYNTNII